MAKKKPKDTLSEDILNALDVRHWQARLEDRPIEEGISAMEHAPGHRDRLTDADRKFYRDKYERRDTRFVPRPDEWKRMTDYEKSLWLGPEEAPLDVAIQESLGRMTDVDREYWLEQMKTRKK